MAYQALYRSYRPQTFKEVVGQKHIIQTLRNAILNSKISHAYIFSGPRGIGKTTIARIFAKAINCEHHFQGEPCNECEHCQSISNDRTTDIVELDAASNNGVDEIRNILEKVNFLPSTLNYKVYIIDEVHMLSMSAFNALLKTLEEPPAHVIFILATTEPHKIPMTIHSRCQRFDFKPLTHQEIKGMLQTVASKENITINDEALNGIAEAAEGGMRDALSMLDQVQAYSEADITIQDVNNVTGRVSNHQLIELISSFHQKDVGHSLEMINEIVEGGKEVSRIIYGLIQLCRDILLYQVSPNKDNQKFIFALTEFQELGKSIRRKQLFQYIDILTDIQNKIKWTTSQKIYLEIGIMKIITASEDETVTPTIIEQTFDASEIEDRLLKLEAKVLALEESKEEHKVIEPVEGASQELVKFQQAVDEANQLTNVMNDRFNDFVVDYKRQRLDIEEKLEIVDVVGEAIHQLKTDVEGLKGYQNELKEQLIQGQDAFMQDIQTKLAQLEQSFIPVSNGEPQNAEEHNLFTEAQNQSSLEERIQSIEELNEMFFTQLSSLNEQTTSINAKLSELTEEKANVSEFKENVMSLIQELKDHFASVVDQVSQFSGLINSIKQQLDAIETREQKVETSGVTVSEFDDLVKNFNNIKDYCFKLGGRIQKIEDTIKKELPDTSLKPTIETPKEEIQTPVEPINTEPKTVVVRTPREEKRVDEYTVDQVETDRVYDVRRVQTILHESRDPRAREEKAYIMNAWKHLDEKVSYNLITVAKYLMDGLFVANGSKEMIIVYPSAQTCNYLMEESVHFQAKQILKNALGKDFDFIALPESVWQEKRKEYHGQYYMGVKYPELTPINHPELRIVKVNKEAFASKSMAEQKAEAIFGKNLIKKEGE